MAAAIKDTVSNVLEKLHLSGPANDGAAPPAEPSQEELKQLKERYEKAGQEQVFAFWDHLSSADKGFLYQQLSDINPEYVNDITHRALNPPKAESEDAKPKLEQLPESATSSVYDSKPEDLK